MSSRWRPNESWSKIQHSNPQKSSFTRDYVDKNKNVIPNVSSFYITNYPDYIIPRDLRRAYERIGKVTDVFIPNKRSWFGKIFGFVRLSGVTDNDDMIT